MEEQRLETSKEQQRSTQYIVTRLGNEQYGIDIKYVNNIVRMQSITRVPNAQHYFKGVINLRGEVIPVMSLRLKFDIEEVEETKDTRIIILKPDKQSSVGIIVDGVKEVVALESNDMEKATVDSEGSRNQYIAMIGKYQGELISIINIESLIAEEKM